MSPALSQAIAATGERLPALAAGAPPEALLCLTVDLGPVEDDSLVLIPSAGEWWHWARDDESHVGLGAALQVETAGPARFAALDHAVAGLRRDWRGDREGRAFFGFAFDPDGVGELPNTRLVVPALTLACRGGRQSLTLVTTAGRAGEAPAAWLALLAPAPAAASPAVEHLPDPLADRAWLGRVRAALQAIGRGDADKLVLARAARLRGTAPFAPAPLLAALRDRQPGCALYALGDGPRFFLGATPERLVRLAGSQAEADALAGTAWLSATGPGAPLSLADAKNRREQALVADAVAAALAPYCADLRAEPPEVLHLRQLSHLRSRIAGRVHPGVSLFGLAGALHPTPAVGGFPGAAARRWLKAHGERRGAWYSGGFGWVDGRGDGEIAVALRCAEVAGREATLWAGAGIVAGSEPESELAETEAKLQAMLDVFRHPAAPWLAARTGTA